MEFIADAIKSLEVLLLEGFRSEGKGLVGKGKRELCGEPRAFANRPELWGDALPALRADGHKYDRGHLLVAGGAEMTGAAMLW